MIGTLSTTMKSVLKKIKELGTKLCTFPAEHKLQGRVAKLYNDRVSMVNGDKALDWGMAENLGYASIVDGGSHIRMTGQDSGRGTFFPSPCSAT